MGKWLAAALLLTLWAVSPSSASEVISGKVVGVHDGDTLTLLTASQKQVKIRLSEIDAPELDQPYGHKSKAALSDLAFGKTCDATVAATDKYQRKVARVDCDGVHVNRMLVRQGAAWVYTAFPHSTLMDLEESQSQNSKTGLWALPDEQRIEPWRWRKGERDPLKPEPKEEFSCGTKLYCSQMKSCEEARFHLTRCNQKSLDKDYDGIPCESLCGS